MKKALLLALCLMLPAGCADRKQASPAPTQASTEPVSVTEPLPTTEPVTEATEPSTEAPKALTFEDFLKQTRGVWVMEESVFPIHDELYCYSFVTFSEEVLGGGVYPGEGVRPGRIVGFRDLGEGRFKLEILYEAGDYMGEYLEEAMDTLTVRLEDDGSAVLQFEGYEEFVCFYGGTDLDAAQKTIQDRATQS